MKTPFLIAPLLIISLFSQAQQLYTMSGGEVIFQSSSIEQYNTDVNSNVRFTLFFHLGEYVHFDLTDNIGLFSGLGIRNVGLISEENDVRIKYRTYNLGVPLAIKLGSFDKNLYVFGGAEYEWMFHFKQKVFENDEKTKYTEWFSNRTPHFIPSVFAGVQFPMGFQVKFRYYLENYLNNSYQGSSTYSDYTGFNKTQVWYISFSYVIRNRSIRESDFSTRDIAGL
jgi:hypothetical protein